MFRDDEVLHFVFEQAHGVDGIGSVQAIQVLNCLGAPIVPRLIDEYMDASAEERTKFASVLITTSSPANR